MTCRTEYYQERFSTFDDAFKERMIKIENLNKHLDEKNRERLLNNYLCYFNVTVKLEDSMKENLCKDFLLLRIFCEANRNKNLGFVHSIKREELFTEYYEIMTTRLIEKVRQEEGFILSSCRVKTFIMRLIEYMIANNMFFNVPLSYIESEFTDDEKKIFSRFLEENILLRKDLTPEGKGLFGRNEVVNFTYDAFRDYLLSAYLSDYVYESDRKLYDKCITEYTQKDHQLREGITPFLFVHSKNKKSEILIHFLSSFDWYEDTFEGYIWDVPDETVNDDDIKLIVKILNSDNPSYVALRLIFNSRWNLLTYPKLNIRILLDYLSTLDDVALPIFIERVWSNKPARTWGRLEEKTPRFLMIKSLERVLDDEKTCSNDCFHDLFELLLYIAICTKDSGFDVFMKYYLKYKNKDMLERVSQATKSNMLIVKLEEIKRI